MTPFSLHRCIGADLQAAEDLSLEVRKLLSRLVTRRDVFAVELLVRELLVNAVEHGCHSDIRKEVKLDLEMQDGLIAGRVTDQGEGFDHQRVMNERLKGGERGHGLFILESYTDSFQWEDQGRVIIFQRQLET